MQHFLSTFEEAETVSDSFKISLQKIDGRMFFPRIGNWTDFKRLFPIFVRDYFDHLRLDTHCCVYCAVFTSSEFH